MPHSFEVGKTYRNRVGEYVVLSIDGDQMKIRYATGGTLATDVNMQARIWENIQFEEQESRAEERRRLAQEARIAARLRSRQERARPTYGGFQESDFQSKKRTVSWPGRKELGKVLAYELRRRARRPYLSWPVPRQASLHLARKEQYNAEAPGRNVALYVSVGEQGLSYGLYVGRPEGTVVASAPWSVLLSALSREARVRQAFRSAMEAHQLCLDVYGMQVSYGLVARVTLQSSGFLWEQESSQQGMARPMDWEELVDALRTLLPEKRCELFLCKRLPAEEAIRTGSGIVDAVLPVFEALLPVYDAGLGA